MRLIIEAHLVDDEGSTERIQLGCHRGEGKQDNYRGNFGFK